MSDKVKWGLMGAGNIVDRWIKGAKQIGDMEVFAVSSRTHKSAEESANRYGINNTMTYEEIVKCSDIDIIYVASPHTHHVELAEMAMESGKAVLVEKPAAVNERDLVHMIECARKNDVFLMEAAWTRFFPVYEVVKKIIKDGTIGEVRAVNSAFSFRAPADNLKQRLLNPELAGGGLLDVGVYNMHLCDMIFDKSPLALTGFASINTDDKHIKVDEQAMYIAKYDKGELASMASGVRTDMLDTAFIYGTEGYIEIPVFWKPTSMKMNVKGNTEEYNMPIFLNCKDYEDEGYQFEIVHVNDCFRKGLKESPVMTWERSLRVIKQCDELRNKWGLIYPFEK